MAPTFLPFLAFLIYLWVSAGCLVIFLPMLLFPTRRLFAKKAIITVLISFPCLVTAGILVAIVFLLPAMLFSWLSDNHYIAQKPGSIIAICGLLLFVISVAVSALYLWHFLSKLIYQILEKSPVSTFLDKNKAFNFFKPYLGKSIKRFFRKNRILKIIVTLLIVPAFTIACWIFYGLFSNLAFVKPTQHDLVGKYHISKVTVSNFDPFTFKKFKLEFKSDSTFTLTPTPNIEICDSGKYAVDYLDDDNEITFKCSSYITFAHIDRHYGYYRIEFIIGDPDSGESIYFEKDK